MCNLFAIFAGLDLAASAFYPIALSDVRRRAVLSGRRNACGAFGLGDRSRLLDFIAEKISEKKILGIESCSAYRGCAKRYYIFGIYLFGAFA
jgi:hypothetical protein